MLLQQPYLINYLNTHTIKRITHLELLNGIYMYIGDIKYVARVSVSVILLCIYVLMCGLSQKLKLSDRVALYNQNSQLNQVADHSLQYYPTHSKIIDINLCPFLRYAAT